jgi:phosphopentomutase
MAEEHMPRVVLIVLDSVGCGDAPDAAQYGDEGSNTLGNIAHAVGGLRLPHLGSLGLGCLASIEGVPPAEEPLGAYGRLTEMSAGKDTTTGHWELAGVPVYEPFPTYPNGFPPQLIAEFERRIGRETMGNYPASGTAIIQDLGEEHVRTGKPIVYTSADSVFQIAAHEEVIPVDQLYHMSQLARDMLTGEHGVGRVIARPFIGKPGNFTRTQRRKDFSLTPESDTILDVVKAAGQPVMGVGKIEDIFANRGLTHSNHTTNNRDGVEAILQFMEVPSGGLIFANLIDFDMLYGHRNNPRGYAESLEGFDSRLPDIQDALHPGDVLMLTADHGNDPTTPSTDHSRERVPILVSGQRVQPGIDVGTRDTFADVAATVADLLAVDWRGAGHSFAPMIVR